MKNKKYSDKVVVPFIIGVIAVVYSCISPVKKDVTTNSSNELTIKLDQKNIRVAAVSAFVAHQMKRNDPYQSQDLLKVYMPYIYMKKVIVHLTMENLLEATGTQQLSHMGNGALKLGIIKEI